MKERQVFNPFSDSKIGDLEIVDELIISLSFPALQKAEMVKWAAPPEPQFV